jgi:hypothetical protein
MDSVIDMMEETLQICEKAQRSTQGTSHRKTFPFGLRAPSGVYTQQAPKSIQIQSGRQQPSCDLKVEPLAHRDPLGIPCIYHKGAQQTLCGCRLRKKIVQERDVARATQAPTSPNRCEFHKDRIRISPKQPEIHPVARLGGLSEQPTAGRRDGFRGGTSDPSQRETRPEVGGGEVLGGTLVVDVKSAPHANHTEIRISWLHTRGPGVEIWKRASQFSLKLTG